MKNLSVLLKPVLVLLLLCGFCRNSSAQRFFSSADFTYSAFSFQEAKLTGSYGFEINLLGHNSKSKFGAGLNAGYGMTYGLIPDILGQFHYVYFGPALGYAINTNMAFTLPIDLLCSIVVNDDDKPRAQSWGMTITPTFKMAKIFGITLGPQMTIPFVKGGKVSFGFKVGICVSGGFFNE